MASVRGRGFAMIDVLVALLLLAVALGGACASLIHTMRTTHGALLMTRAVDLAADLAEELREVTSEAQVEPVLAAWRERVGATLPVAGLEPAQFAAVETLPQDEDPPVDAASIRHELTLRWHAASHGGLHELRLPLVLVLQDS